MTYREFVTLDGRIWEAWEVRPIAIERRLNDDRRQHSRFSHDRRSSELQFKMHGSLREGWVTFQCGQDKRRITPIPAGWGELPDAGLVALLALAVPLRRVQAALSNSTREPPALPLPVFPPDSVS